MKEKEEIFSDWLESKRKRRWPVTSSRGLIGGRRNLKYADWTVYFKGIYYKLLS